MKVINSIKRLLLGYDIFISYSRKDSLEYAYAIAQHFMKKGFECYIDQLSSTRPGGKISDNIINAIKRSNGFILIGSEGAQLSKDEDPISQEIDTFLKYNGNKFLLPINVGLAINIDNIKQNKDVSTSIEKKIFGLTLIPETIENFKNSKPSERVLTKIENSLNFSKKSKRLRNIAITIPLIILFLSVVLYYPYQRWQFIRKITDSPLRKQFQDAGGELDSVKKLILENGNYLIVNKKLNYFNELDTLEINESEIKDLSLLEGISELKHLEFNNTFMLTDLKGIEVLKSINSLQINSFDNLKDLRGIKNLSILKHLDIADCNNLISLKGIENLKSLNTLLLMDNDKLMNLDGVENLKMLNNLIISGCKNLKNLDAIKNSKVLEILSISVFSLTDINKLENLPKLNRLLLYNDIIGFSDSLKVKKINNFPPQLTNLHGIVNLKRLQHLEIDNTYLADMKGIEGHKALKTLSITYNYNLESLKGIDNLDSLAILYILENEKLTNLKGLGLLPSINSLSIYYNQNLRDLSGIENLISLSNLEIEGNDELINLDGIGNLFLLNSLKISSNSNLASIEGLENFNFLSSLEISSNNKLKSIKGIEQLQLTTLTVMNNPLLEIDFIYSLQNLEELFIDKNFHLDEKRLRKNNPNVKITKYEI